MKISTFAFVLCLSVLLAGCGGSSDAPTEPTPTATLEPTVYQRSILALGDSLTEGYGLKKEKSYPRQLQEFLDEKGYQYKVINSGVSGETTTGLLQRLDWVLGQDPDLIILTIGANDAIRGINLDITRQNLESIIQTIQAKDIDMIFSGMQIYENLGPEYVTTFQNLYTEMAQKYELNFIPFFLEGVAGDPVLNITDQIHPNAEGYKIIVEQNIWPVLEPMLEKK